MESVARLQNESGACVSWLFHFRQCGTYFIKDGRQYKLQTKDLCAQAREAGIDYKPALE